MKKILIIEDQEDILDDLGIILSKNGFSVSAAANGELGLKIARETIPDLIISDIMMPGIDGYKVLEELSRDEKTSLIPFIFLTAKAEISDLRKGMDLGADDYIFKPFDADNLIAAVNARLKKSERLKRGAIHSLVEIFGENESRLKTDDKIFISGKQGSIPIKLNEIVYVKAENQYSSLFCSNKKNYLIRKPLSKWAQLFPANKFIRIHRSYIINYYFIKEIIKRDKNNYSVVMENCDNQLDVARNYVKSLKLATVKKNM